MCGGWRLLLPSYSRVARWLSIPHVYPVQANLLRQSTGFARVTVIVRHCDLIQDTR